MTSQIIELKQEDLNTSVTRNGNYECNITQNLTLNQGDQIMLKNAFIDSSALDTSSLILTREIELTIQFIRYTSDLFVPSEGTHPFDKDVDGEKLWVPPPTGLPLFDCIETSAGAVDKKAISIYIFRDILSEDLKWGYSQTITYEYEDWSDTGLKLRKHFNLPALITPADGELWARYVIDVDFHIKEGTFKDITPASVKNTAGYSSISINLDTPNAAKTYIPKQQQKKLKIAPGTYSPSDLAGLISEGFQKARAGQFVYTGPPIQNTLIQPIGKKLYDYETFLASAKGGFIDPIGEVGFLFNILDSSKDDTFNVLTGTSQFGFDYDTTLNKFFFSDIHTPLYTEKGALRLEVGAWSYDQSDKPYFQPDMQTGIPSYTYYKNTSGGILFNSLTAEYTDTGEIYDFWQGQLGFDTNAMTVDESYLNVQVFFPYEGNFPSYTTYSIPNADIVQFGTNATAPEVIMTDLVEKTTSAYIPYNTFEVTPTNTAKIYANRQVFEGNQITGFYYIDVIAEFQNTLLQQTQATKHTVALVSNYFNNQSVTTGTSSDSIIYTHQGQPLVLSTFTVNILDQDRNNPPIGPNNYIFLDIVNNQPTIAMKEQQQAEIEAQTTSKKKNKSKNNKKFLKSK